MVESDGYFPRGGGSKTPLPTISDEPKNKKIKFDKKEKDDVLFKNDFPTRKIKKKKNKNDLRPEEANLLSYRGSKDKMSFTIDSLSFEGLSEGFLTLGRIVKINDHEIIVSLPGRTLGSVKINEVSKPYTKLIEKLTKADINKLETPILTLENMFQIGQALVVKVISIEKSEKRTMINLSTNPRHVNSNYSIRNIDNGMVFIGAVESIEDHGYIIDIGIKEAKSFLTKDAAQLLIKSRNKKPLGVGELISCKVTNIKVQGSRANLLLSASPKDVLKYIVPDDLQLNYNLLLPGMQVSGIIMETHKTGLKVHFLNMTGLVHQDSMNDPWTLPTSLEMGSTINFQILYILPNGTQPYLTLQANLSPYQPQNEKFKVPKIKPGEKHSVKIVRIEKRGLIVRFSGGEKGIVTSQRCSDNLNFDAEDIVKKFPEGSSHECRVIQHSFMDNIFIASFQSSLLKENFLTPDQVEVGRVVRCKIEFWNKGGAMVSFGKIRGFIPKLHFGNVPLLNPEIKYPSGSQIRARVFQKNSKKNSIILTAKKKLIKADCDILSDLSKIEMGMTSLGIVKSVIDAGLIIISFGGVLGFAPKSLVSNAGGVNYKDLYFEGQIVNLKVQLVNLEKSKLIFNLRYEEDEQELKNKIEKNDILTKFKEDVKKLERTEKNKKKRKAEKGLEEDSEIPDKKKKKKTKENLVEEEEETSKNVTNQKEKESEAEAEQKEKKKKKRKNKKEKLNSHEESGLELKIDSFWDLNTTEEINNDEDDKYSSSEEENEEKTQKKEKRKKLSYAEMALNKEESIREKEVKLANSFAEMPQSIDDFDRAVLASPNSSIIWCSYMAYFIQSAEYDKAREIGRRALTTISYREDQEKLNIWISLINLENTFGTPESTNEIFLEAVKANDDYKIYKHTASIYAISGKNQEAERLYKIMLKKYKSNPEIWILVGSFYFKAKNFDEARNIFGRSLHAVNKKESITLISKFGHLEFIYGEPERARTIFDKLMDSYPKRTDLWIVYANALIKSGNIESAREVFDRATKVELPPTKIKAIFKRYVEFEKEHGTTLTFEALRKKAQEYVDNFESNS